MPTILVPALTQDSPSICLVIWTLADFCLMTGLNMLIMHHSTVQCRPFLSEVKKGVKKREVGDKRLKKFYQQKQNPTRQHVCFVRHPWELKPIAFLANTQKLQMLKDLTVLSCKPSIAFSKTEAKAGTQQIRAIYLLQFYDITRGRTAQRNSQLTFQMASALFVIHKEPRGLLHHFNGSRQIVFIYFLQCKHWFKSPSLYLACTVEHHNTQCYHGN